MNEARGQEGFFYGGEHKTVFSDHGGGAGLRAVAEHADADGGARAVDAGVHRAGQRAAVLRQPQRGADHADREIQGHGAGVEGDRGLFRAGRRGRGAAGGAGNAAAGPAAERGGDAAAGGGGRKPVGADDGAAGGYVPDTVVRGADHGGAIPGYVRLLWGVRAEGVRAVGRAAVHHIGAHGLSGGIHRAGAVPLRGVRAGAEEPGGGGRGDAGAVPGAVGAVLRRLQRRGRGVADAGAGGKGAGAERRRRAAVLGIVAPYTGREIETRRYCSRLALPVEE